jgi:2-isopropylmalate synthase
MQYLAADPGETPEEQAANVLVEMQISVEGEVFSGRARERDILPCCVAAFIDAASNADAVRAVRARQAAQPRAA